MATRPKSLRSAVRRSVRAMHWLTDADQAAVDLALNYAGQIDDAVQAGDAERAEKLLGWMGPHLTGLLKQLGATPEGRRGLAVETEVKGRLAELRAKRTA